MAHFAKVGNDGIVVSVIKASQDFIDSGVVGNPSNYVQTSYNTSGGVHLQGGTPLRKNFASIGFTYDSERDAFIPPKPYPSWVLDEQTCLWFPPVAHPDTMNAVRWDEDTLSWIELT